jgi:hypothetical protein
MKAFATGNLWMDSQKSAAALFADEQHGNGNCVSPAFAL